MESAPLCANSEDREEGEIVDDDFEDISDNSIIVPIYSGKSVSPKEHLHAISLSSVTEVDEPKSEIKTRHHHKISRKKVSKSKKRKNSHRKSTCSDSDSDDCTVLDRKLQKQLKAAVRVDDTEERHQNSLRSRLKGMTKLDESDNPTEKLDNEEKVEDKDGSEEGDNELAQLRMEALRTAVLNKFKHRKKRKVKESNDNGILSDVSVKTDNSETNKENNHNVIENCPKKVCVENPSQNAEKKLEIEIVNNVAENSTLPEDDEDVLRALLLASMSKKITSETEKKKIIAPLPNNGIKRTVQTVDVKKDKNVILRNTTVKKQVIKNNIVITKNLQFPEVKPLIINLNEDSDSEDDIFNKTTKNVNNQVTAPKIDIEIESTVEKFLKEQRAKVEAQLSPIPKTPVKSKTSSCILEKSAVKLLPKVKQVEYQKLLQKLKNAEKKPRIRRSSHKFNSEGKPIAYTAKKIVRTKLPISKPVNSVPKADPVEDVKNEVRTLHKILKEIQVQKNGRLQIQEKYKALMPVIKKINEASVERRKREEDVKRLLQEITEMKSKLVKSQQEFTAFVNKLVQQKEQLDKSMDLKKSEDSRALFTSTPIKEKPPAISVETSPLPAIAPKSALPLNERPATQGVEKEEEIVEAPLNPGDPNDIDKIYNKQQSTFPKYISPLDKVNRVVTCDPFSIICPYDVGGNCRDPECIYKHF